MTEKVSRKQLVQLLVLVVIGWGVAQVLQRTAPIGRDVGANGTARAALSDTTSPSSEVRDPTLTLVVFTDYQCPACKLSNPAMDAAVAKDGHVRVVYRDWPIFGDRSERAARVAIAADRQGIYPEVHRRLLNERRVLDDEVLHAAVEGAGGCWSRLQADLREHDPSISQQLNRNRGDVFALGIAGTPAYLVGPLLIVGGTDEAGFAKAFALGREAGSS